MAKLVYADNAATTKLDSDAFEAMRPYLLEEYGNVSQPYSFSRKAKKEVQKAREIIAGCIGAEPEEIFFTSGGTESDNWAISEVYSDDGRNGIVTSSIEHHAVLNACLRMASKGADVSYLPVDGAGVVGIDTFRSNISDSTYLASVMLSNNEIGTIQDIAALAEISHEWGVVFHSDAVQSVGHIPVNVKKLKTDLLSASAHKFNGPKGIGLLYVKKGTKIRSFINGGRQESGMRAGTENVAAIIGMAYALKKNVDSLCDNMEKISALESELMARLESANIDFVRNGSVNHVPGNISLSFKGFDGEMLMHRLDLMGIMVSTGAACDTKDTQISHVLKAIGLDREYAEGTIRISFSKDNTMEDVSSISNAIEKIVLG